jgi:hypothetical protein
MVLCYAWTIALPLPYCSLTAKGKVLNTSDAHIGGGVNVQNGNFICIIYEILTNEFDSFDTDES